MLRHTIFILKAVNVSYSANIPSKHANVQGLAEHPHEVLLFGAGIGGADRRQGGGE